MSVDIWRLGYLAGISGDLEEAPVENNWNAAEFIPLITFMFIFIFIPLITLQIYVDKPPHSTQLTSQVTL